MTRRRIPLLVAGVLVAVAALLFALSDQPRATPSESPPEFPRHVRQAEVKRLQARRTLPPPGTPLGPPAPGVKPPALRDPFLVALPRDQERPLLVLEANALRHSRLGELFVGCVFEGARRDPFEAVRREFGIDPLKDLDRIALAQDGIVLSGFFERARRDRLEADSDAAAYGDAGTVYRPRPGDRRGTVTVATWGENLLLLGEPAFVESSIDRLEGRAAEVDPVIPEHLTYGEAYGVLTGEGLRELFRGEHSDLGRRLAEVASRIELHADAMRDVAVSASVTGPDAARVDDLGSAFGAALAVARLQSRARGDERLTELLEHARVERQTDGFTVELAIPVAILESWFQGCGTAAAPISTPSASP